MRIGAAEAKVVNGDVFLVPRPWPHFFGNSQIPLIQRYVRIRHFEVAVGGYELSLQHQRSFDDSNDAAGIFEMADICLDGSNRNGFVLWSGRAKHTIKGVGFDGVPNLSRRLTCKKEEKKGMPTYFSSSTMSLDESSIPRIQPSICVDLPYQSLLRTAIRCR